MILEQRVENLENMLAGIVKNMNKAQQYTSYDIAGCRSTESGLTQKNTEQDSGIKENSDGLFDVAGMADENSSAVFDLADYTAALDERITALEEKEG